MLGYEKINDIFLPDKIKNLKLTNPDAPTINYCTWVYMYNNLIPVAPLVLFKRDRSNVNSSKDILNSIITKMLELEEIDGFFKVTDKGELLSRDDIIRFKNDKGYHMNLI